MAYDCEAFVKKLASILGCSNAEQEQKYRAELTKALADYAEIKRRSEPLDRTELYRIRLALRPDYENTAIDVLRKMLGGDFSVWDFRDAVAAADNTLGERNEEKAAKELLRSKERQQKSEQKISKHHEQER